MPRIDRITGRCVFDSRGWPAIEADVTTAGGASARAVAPSPDVRNPAAACELRDGGAAFGGLGVARAISQLNTVIAPALIGLDVRDQATIDRRMIALDGTPDKSRLGANSILAVSLAVAMAEFVLRAIRP